MKLPRREFLHLAAGAAALPVVSRFARAQAYPTRPVRIIAPTGPAGAPDILARLIGPWLSERLGQQFVVENRPGSGNNIGTEAVVRAPPDGYTLLIVSSSNTINATLYDKLNFVFLRDIAPVAGLISLPFVMVVNPSVPAKTVAELAAYAKANPGRISFGSPGIGTPGHVAGEPFEVVNGEYTGLPIPAQAEIVLEGEMPPPDVESRPEGPFGEWTGYYASATRPAPVIHVKRVYYRTDPIITVVGDLKIYPLDSYLSLLFRSAEIWNELEKCGVTDVKGVWQLESGMRFLQVISLRQRYGGHARQAAHVALGAREGGYLGRFVILVDDDIDPSNMADVLWAIATRCDPETSIEIMRGCWSSPIDPRIPPERRSQGDFTNSRAIIDACRPFRWIKDFSKDHALTPEERAQTAAKWKHVLS